LTGEVSRSPAVVVGAVVVVASDVVVVSDVDVVDEVVVSSASDPEQAERNNPSAVRTTKGLRIGGML
jgi:hypothetical protein